MTTNIQDVAATVGYPSLSILYLTGVDATQYGAPSTAILSSRTRNGAENIQDRKKYM